MLTKVRTLSLALALCLLSRLIPFRAPNIEPVLATAMPLGGVYGAGAGAFLGIASVLLYDLVTRTWGVHTLFVAFSFGMLGFWSGRYFKAREATTAQYVRFAIVGTLLFDAVTGLIPGPLFFHQPFLAALLGQIPFTTLHLLGNIAFACTLSPWIHHALVRKREEKASAIITSTINPTVI